MGNDLLMDKLWDALNLRSPNLYLITREEYLTELTTIIQVETLEVYIK